MNRVMAAESRKRATVTRIFDLDRAFHSGYVDGVSGPRLLALHHAIKPQVERYARLYISSLVDELPTSVREHAAMSGHPREARARGLQRLRSGALGEMAPGGVEPPLADSKSAALSTELRGPARAR